MPLFDMYPQEYTVEEFIAKFGKPYDPEHDDYVDPGPFAADISVGRSSPIYNAHSYHTKVPPEGIVAYLMHYTRPGDVVLDPFCGSGMTGVACMMCAEPPAAVQLPPGSEQGGRYSVLNDLSPAACHIAYNYTHPVDPHQLRAEWALIKGKVGDEFGWLYGTSHDDGTPATIEYTVWSDVDRCPECQESFVLWDVAIDHETGKIHESFPCPGCGQTLTKSKITRTGREPVITDYSFARDGRTARASHPTTVAEKARISEIDSAPIPHWYPTDPFTSDREMYTRCALHLYGISTTVDFYTKRNLRAIARLWQESEECSPSVRRAIRFAVTAVLQKHATIMTAMILKGGSKPVLTGNQPGTLYIPAFSVEKNLLAAVNRKITSIVSAINYLPQTLSQSVVNQGSAADLSGTPSDSVDYVFTDPPFGSNIFYSDCSFLWEAWLRRFTDEADEAVVHLSHRDKNTLDDYEHIMSSSFREIYRVLKPGRYASVVFHSSDDKVWHVIQQGCLHAGFEIANALVFDKQQKSFKGIKGAKGEEDVHNVDVVLNLRKPAAPGKNGQTRLAPDIEDHVLDIIADHLASGPVSDQRTTQYLRTVAIQGLLQDSIRIEKLEMPYLDRVLAENGLRRIGQFWYLPDEDVALEIEAATLGLESPDLIQVKDELTAIAWLRAKLKPRPQRRGDLTVDWQRATVGLPDARLDLDQLLDDNFTDWRQLVLPCSDN